MQPELEDMILESYKTENQRGKKLKNGTEYLRTGVNTKRYNLHIMGIPEGKEKRTESVLEGTMIASMSKLTSVPGS